MRLSLPEIKSGRIDDASANWQQPDKFLGYNTRAVGYRTWHGRNSDAKKRVLPMLPLWLAPARRNGGLCYFVACDKADIGSIMIP
jgi:hypothetical protein